MAAICLMRFVLCAKDLPIMTVEANIRTGRLGQKIQRLIVLKRNGNPFVSLVAPDKYMDRCLSQHGALRWAGIDASSVTTQFERLVNHAQD